MNRTNGFMPKTCPGINKFIRPTMVYVKCRVCGGDIEIWSDEDSAFCINCGAEWRRPDEDASCLKYCEYADKCKLLINSTRR
ncbi:hypothetical protein KEJ21_00675 [Candidatus Bathyarchaeota archaeon]|nr:hypothetical protein [Candidatus Bathyarchaeota archaeon]MBS7631617.1 hypothetical protein [Candidatus Bathyarchaeota archaeon]